jgi:hypothetical protein
LSSIDEKHSKKPRERKTDARYYTPKRFTKDVLKRTHFLKTGEYPGIGETQDAGPFSSQKARSLNLNTYSFPIFVIHRNPGRGNIPGDKKDTKDQIHREWK